MAKNVLQPATPAQVSKIHLFCYMFTFLRHLIQKAFFLHVIVYFQVVRIKVNVTNGVELTPIIIIISASIGGIMVIAFIIIVLFLMVSTVIYFTLVKGIVLC